MKVALTPEDLIKFEEEVCKNFSEKKIRAPIHLDNGNEEQLIEIFEKFVDEDDWILGSWRQHYKCLLKGVPPEKLMQAILEGKSISLCFPQYNVISSAIVGGILPIAVGIGMGIKKAKGTNKVVCFLGEMSSETGMAHECIKYSTAHKLPLLWVVEDNGKSVCTPTLPVWGLNKLTYAPEYFSHPKEVCPVRENVLYYRYESKYPHAGGTERVQF